MCASILWIAIRSCSSAWFWLYTAAAVVGGSLVKLNSGVGFLLSATDVERQPLRSMGFVSLILVNVLFAVGLPVVLLIPG